MYESPLVGENLKKDISQGSRYIPKDSFIYEQAFVIYNIETQALKEKIARAENTTLKDIVVSTKFLKAGPRHDIFFAPEETKVCIVTCGGLCPGLNTVIRELVMSLWFNYEVRDIYGIKWGYKGFYTDTDVNWQKLTPSDVSMIHKKGGTILGSSRGGFDGDKILDELIKKDINMCFIIGGDGTHRGIYHLSTMAIERGLNISFAGIPKTIDNDIPIIDQSFGFETSCAVAAEMI